MQFKVFSDPRCLAHLVPSGFPEIPSRLEVLTAGLAAEGYEIVERGEHPGSAEAIAFVHDTDYLRRFQESVAGGELFLDTGDNPLSAGTWEASMAAVEVNLHAADWIAAGLRRQAFCLVRPPGHHAERFMAMGFCYFNNVAVTAEYLIRRKGFSRVAIVDFDVHHGNGTQHVFEERGDVLYASVHQSPLYPGTGAARERGRGAGLGATLNVPLPPGSRDSDYEKAFGAEVLPALGEFSPQVLLVSAGFDAWQGDPVGGMRVTESAFESWGDWLGRAAERLCEGRVLVTLEGGYDLDALPDLAIALCRGLRSETPAG
jgi:acetoin utilization deacetylase AcuC-like enzyme